MSLQVLQMMMVPKTTKPATQTNVPKIQIGKIYKRSLGHAGSP